MRLHVLRCGFQFLTLLPEPLSADFYGAVFLCYITVELEQTDDEYALEMTFCLKEKKKAVLCMNVL